MSMMMRRIGIGFLIACWVTLAIAQALPHTHDGTEAPAKHPCALCRAQHAFSLPETVCILILPAALVLLTLVHRADAPALTAWWACPTSRAPPVLA